MKKIPFLCIISCLSILMFVLSCKSGIDSDINAIVDSICRKAVPDSREGLADINLRMELKGRVIITGETTSSDAIKEIKDTLVKAGYSVTDSVKLLPDTVHNKAYMGLATLSVINLRKEPDHSSELVSQAVMGTPVMILKEDDGWVLIQTPDNYISWTEKSSLVLLTSAELENWKRSDRVIFRGSSGWITAAPGSEDVIGDLVAGAIMVRGGVSNYFTIVVLPDGRTGYVDSRLLADFSSLTDPPALLGDEILRRASMYTGLPYLWGGSSAKAVDCSGFVQSVYFMNGIILSRDASLQAGHGISIDISKGYENLAAGDLLFFGSGGRVSHVAIYRGNSEFIHAASKVTVNSFDSTRSDYSGYRRRSLVSARRIIGADFDEGLQPLARHKWYN